MSEPDRAAVARRIIDENLYMVLGTADGSGRPWATPVYYASSGYREFFWVSSPDATHSRNIGVRPQVAIVIFDSRASIGTGQGVYMTAVAEAAAGADVERGIEVFSRRSQRHGGQPWTVDDVRGEIRLYRAMASGHSMLAKDGRPDHRIPVELEAAGR
jgi:uncharacterized protein YhbP (UPF0306 family)